MSSHLFHADKKLPLGGSVSRKFGQKLTSGICVSSERFYICALVQFTSSPMKQFPKQIYLKIEDDGADNYMLVYDQMPRSALGEPAKVVATA
jgi:hypothetical protein